MAELYLVRESGLFSGIRTLFRHPYDAPRTGEHLARFNPLPVGENRGDGCRLLAS